MSNARDTYLTAYLASGKLLWHRSSFCITQMITDGPDCALACSKQENSNQGIQRKGQRKPISILRGDGADTELI